MPRAIVRLELTAGAKKALKELTAKLGMTQVALISRMVEWFARQDEFTQRSALGQIPAELGEELSRLLTKKAK